MNKNVKNNVNVGYNAWIKPTDDNLQQEYKVEYQLKPGIRNALGGNVWPTFDSFKDSIDNGTVVKFDNSKDLSVGNRSRTVDKEDLLNLISGYASYPEFRNEKTVENLYNRIKANKPLHMPIVVKMPNGRLRIMSGNTRADVAMQLVGSYTAIVIEPQAAASINIKEEKKKMKTKNNNNNHLLEMKMVYPELFSQLLPTSLVKQKIQEQTIGDITLPVETETRPEDQMDPTVPMTHKPTPVPYSRANDSLFSDPIAEETLYSKVVQPFSGEKYAELGAIVGMLEGLSVLFQTLHWQVNGQSFYGDHLMFQRIYESFDEQIDSVAEKAVTFGNHELVDSKKITETMELFLNHVRANSPLDTVESAVSFSKRGKYALEIFVHTTEKMMAELSEKDNLSNGLDNLLAGILDAQEGNIFLLKQRVTSGF